MPTAEDRDRDDRYLPALRFRPLNALFDSVVRLMREGEMKNRLLDQAAPRPGQRILDIGRGTGTLAMMAKEREPAAEVVGLDADPEILERARAKARKAHTEVQFDRGLSSELPHEGDSFDVVLSTLFFHHLTGIDKRTTASEIARVLRPGGELHVVDFGRPPDPLIWSLFGLVRVFDGFEKTRDNAAGALPKIFEAGGLEEAAETDRLRTVLGALSLYRAQRPSIDSGGSGAP